MKLLALIGLSLSLIACGGGSSDNPNDNFLPEEEITIDITPNYYHDCHRYDQFALVSYFENIKYVVRLCEADNEYYTDPDSNDLIVVDDQYYRTCSSPKSVLTSTLRGREILVTYCEQP